MEYLEFPSQWIEFLLAMGIDVAEYTPDGSTGVNHA